MKYSFTSRIRYSEIGEDGNLTLPGLINYFQDREKHSRQELIDYMLLILRTSISAILKEKSADARND